MKIYVPVNETINIIINNVYNKPISLSPQNQPQYASKNTPNMHYWSSISWPPW